MQTQLPQRFDNDHIIEPVKVVYLQSSANYTYIHTNEYEFLSSRTLKVWESKPNFQNFLRINRGLVINKSALSKINLDKHNPYVILSCGTKLAISRRRLAFVTEQLK
jgi:DNA-binding LytR/AlgR family response regulator